MQTAQLVYLYLSIVGTVLVFILSFLFWDKLKGPAKKLSAHRHNPI